MNKQITVRVHPETHELLKRESVKQGRTISKIVERAIQNMYDTETDTTSRKR